MKPVAVRPVAVSRTKREKEGWGRYSPSHSLIYYIHVSGGLTKFYAGCHLSNVTLFLYPSLGPALAELIYLVKLFKQTFIHFSLKNDNDFSFL